MNKLTKSAHLLPVDLRIF